MKYTYRGYDIVQHDEGGEWSVSETASGNLITTVATPKDAITYLDTQPNLNEGV
jgi:hypothetical protein